MSDKPKNIPLLIVISIVAGVIGYNVAWVIGYIVAKYTVMYLLS